MKSSYIKTNWVDNKTPVDADHLGNIESGIETLYEEALSKDEIKAGTNIEVTETSLGEIKISTSSDILNKDDVIDSLSSTDTTRPLSANKGRELSNMISEVTSGKFLALWDCSTGRPSKEPAVDPYKYEIGDYYIVNKVAGTGGTNYKPNGYYYHAGCPSTDVESEYVIVKAVYYFDGENWMLTGMGGTAAWGHIGGDIEDQTDLMEKIKQSDWEQTDENEIDFIKNKPENASLEEIRSLFNN